MHEVVEEEKEENQEEGKKEYTDLLATNTVCYQYKRERESLLYSFANALIITRKVSLSHFNKRKLAIFAILSTPPHTIQSRKCSDVPITTTPVMKPFAIMPCLFRWKASGNSSRRATYIYLRMQGI